MALCYLTQLDVTQVNENAIEIVNDPKAASGDNDNL
jgi:hypothetical protein